MIDWSIECPDLCWFSICEHLSISDISRLSSTCRTLRHRLWSAQASLWSHLIRREFDSAVFRQLMNILTENDQDEDSNVAEKNVQFCRRILSDVEAYQAMHEKFLTFFGSRSWISRLTSARNDIRGFFARQRFTFPRSMPFLDSPVPLSSRLFRLHYYRLNQSSSPTAIGTLVYAYLIDCRRRLSIEQLFYQNFPTSINESKPVKIDDNGGVCITNPDLSSTPYSKFELSFDKTPVWADVLPGQYSVTCQLQLRRRCADHGYSDEVLLGGAPVEICLLGDRADRGGRRHILRYSWLNEKWIEWGGDRWFDACLIKNFLLHDISNVYFGIHVENLPNVFRCLAEDSSTELHCCQLSVRLSS